MSTVAFPVNAIVAITKLEDVNVTLETMLSVSSIATPN
ncbi:hypothetical protein DB30_00192 [Enhygromyxa salina]|uniref:Uncharacterized protein n=1 Tax=Enhygromyxa salina TaxID=215803 RepID=A0A0C2DFU4_9BACT|nr:hypothetical protein DB30_00192 [Enhygromyxa salina]